MKCEKKMMETTKGWSDWGDELTSEGLERNWGKIVFTFVDIGDGKWIIVCLSLFDEWSFLTMILIRLRGLMKFAVLLEKNGRKILNFSALFVEFFDISFLVDRWKFPRLVDLLVVFDCGTFGVPDRRMYLYVSILRLFCLISEDAPVLFDSATFSSPFKGFTRPFWFRDFFVADLQIDLYVLLFWEKSRRCIVIRRWVGLQRWK